MVTFNLAEAKAQLSKLVEQAANGGTVRIIRRGKPVAQITPIAEIRKPVDLEALRALTDSMPRQKQSARTFIRKLRDESRY